MRLPPSALVSRILLTALSQLDIGLTLEYLEAHAVPVAGYKTSDWPAFYTAQSGFEAPMQLDSAAEVAQTICAYRSPNLSSASQAAAYNAATQ